MTYAALVWRLQTHDVLPSTSDLCRTLAVQGEPAGLAVLARRQSAGRGSRGRGWDTPAGNLALSVLLRPALPPREAAQMSLLAGVALAETVRDLLPDADLTLKWPNDLLLGGAKLAGILTETHGADGHLDWLVLGIGANLAFAPDVPGRAIATLATHMAPPAPEAFSEALLARLDLWLAVLGAEGFGPIRAAWRRHALAPGSTMSIRIGADKIEGSFDGLGDDGSLRLLTATGARNFTAGDVLLPMEG